jgi:hypothetical protein
MKYFMVRALAVVVTAALLPALAGAETVWEDAWDNRVDWNVYEPTGIQAWWTSDNGVGVFGVSNANVWAHFLASERANVDVKRLKDYVLQLEVKEVSHSMSYQLDLDVFDGNGTYLRTITAFPQGTDEKILTATLNSIKKADWKGVAQLSPKLGISTGKAKQQMKIGVFKIEDTGATANPK